MKKTLLSIAVALAATMSSLPAQAAPANAGPANAAQMAQIAYLLGTWDCSWTAGTASGSLVATFTNVMNGAWIEETEAVQKGDNQTVMTMHFTGYDVGGKRWLHAGPNANGTYEVAQSDDTLYWKNVIPNDGGVGKLDKVSETEYVLSEDFMQGGQKLTYRNDCKKRS